MIINQNEVDTSESDLPEGLLVAMANIYKIYKTSEVETVALRGISLSIFEREIIGVIGPSGSGKSTLISVLAGLIKPTAGIVYWSPISTDISRLSDNKITRVRNQFIGTLTQISETNLIPHMSVIDNVMLQGYIGNRSRSEMKKDAVQLLERVGLESRQKSNPMTLSSGEKQRVALAAALINKPKLILADEPTGALDYDTGEELLELIQEINVNLGTAFLIVTHSQQVVPHTNRIIEIRDGIIAGQHKELNFSNLDQSRILIPDSQGRILLPKELLTAFGSGTNYFKAFYHEGKIILEPITASFLKKSILDSKPRRDTICPICQTLNIGNGILCTNCGSLLRKAYRLTERD